MASATSQSLLTVQSSDVSAELNQALTDSEEPLDEDPTTAVT